MPAYEPWQPDPLGRHQHRWRHKDGTWDDSVSDAGRTSIDPYTGPQPDPDAPPVEQAAAPVEPAATTAAAPTAEPVRATAREPLGFWGQTFAIAIGVALGLLTALVVVALAAAEALEDVL